MKISKKWLSEYISSKKTNDELEDYFTQLGLECTFDSKDINYDNIVVGYVDKCEKHPNADRLKVCKVNVGNEILDVVCGAPNVKENILVPLAKVGAEIGDFKIKKAKIRGSESNGMICSGKELAINDNHQGIMILSSDLKIGMNIKKALSISSDTIFDFDITPNRGDCFSHIGIARELSIIENKKINLNSINLNKSNFNTSDSITVDVEDTNICSRYSCKLIKNIKVGESPDWLKTRLHSIGQSSINNIVDLANYIMFDLGQPLHTFDFDKIKGQQIKVRLAGNTEKIICLDNQTKKLSKDDIVISDKNGPIAIAGVIGGSNTEVDQNTKNILVESAIFNEVYIRRTAKRHGYTTEASKRFERGIDYTNTIYAMDKYAQLLEDISKANPSLDSIDIKDENIKNKKIDFSLEKCNEFLGTDLNDSECKSIFEKLAIKSVLNSGNYNCIIPLYRNDISREVDLFEEVARVFGYNNIKSNNNFSISTDCFITDELIVESKIRNVLSFNGFNEHYSNSLYSDIDISINKHLKPVELQNPLSQDMKFLRNDLLPGLLKTVAYNEKRGQNNLKIFEIGSVTTFNSKKYNKSDEIRNLGIIWALNCVDHWKHSIENDIYLFKGEILNLLKRLNIQIYDFIYKNKSMKLLINEKQIGEILILDNEILNKYDIKNNFAYCRINIDDIKDVKTTLKYKAMSSFPSISRDISILVNIKIKNQAIEETIKKYAGKKLVNLNLFDIYSDSDKSDDNQSLAYSLIFESNTRTLTDIEIDKIMKEIILALKNEYNAIQR